MKHFDIVIVGAGISGIGAACHLRQRCPDKTFALLESRAAIGGTWDLFRYPGIRSDSDMHTFGYSFKPWIAKQAIADGASILAYVNETADEYDIRKHIRFRRRLDAAAWSTEHARWELDVACTDGDGRERLSASFLLMCSGYYSYENPYRPGFEGEKDFEGIVFHPQLWPEGLDYAGKRVIVIGSGATAITLVPAMAPDVEHITMLQRSPTYIIARPEKDAIANVLHKILPAKLAYAITRFKNVEIQRRVYQKTRTHPQKVKDFLLRRVRKHLGPDYDIDRHFTPSYNPWDQRLCLIPGGDLFEAIKSGKASMVTDQIERFTDKGILLASGQELEADIIITATGLQLKLLGGAQLSVDGELVSFPDHLVYRGMMFSDIPNMVQIFGYVNASWTLRADLSAEYACRLINHMDELDVRQCTPRLRDEDRNMARRPWSEEFLPGYLKRVMHLLPKQGEHAPWLNTQSYVRDKKMVRKGPLEDGVLTFDNPVASDAEALASLAT